MISRTTLSLLAMLCFFSTNNFANPISINSLNQVASIPQIAIGNYRSNNNIERPVIITNVKNNSWSYVNTIPSYDTDTTLYKTTCTGRTCIATGSVQIQPYSINNDNRRPLLMVSHDEGKSWSEHRDIKNLPAISDSVVQHIACSGNTCHAVGWYRGADVSEKGSQPLLITSNDNGDTWSFVQNIADMPDIINGSLEGISCSNNNCVAAGSYSTKKRDMKLFFLTSKDKGESWSFEQNISGTSKIKYANLSAVKCYENYCVAAGYYNYPNDYGPTRTFLLLRSNDYGQSWTYDDKIIPELADLDFLFINDTTYLNGSFIIVGGYKKDNVVLDSLILVGKDNGKSWSLIKDFSQDKSKKPGTLRSISCTENICVAGGDDFYKGGTYFGMTLLVSKDNGQSWTWIPYVSGINYTPSIGAVTCNSYQCTAAATYKDDFDNAHPVMIISKDKGQTWHVDKNILNVPSDVSDMKFSSAAYPH